jgi:AcrR family transcriptional regulator
VSAPPDGLREYGKRQRAGRILAAARELLREDPDGGLTVESIAERAEVSQPTVFNLIGRRDEIWAALADQSLAELDFASLDVIADAEERACAVIGAVIDMVCSDAPVFRALLADWSQSARVIHHDPTDALAACLAEAGAPRPRRIAELIVAGLVGVVHQWSAERISNREARARGTDLVRLAFRSIHTNRAEALR